MNLVFLAQRIREFRKKRMLTLEQLAERSQLTQSVLSKVENSRVTPSLAALSRIAEALGITLSELVAGIDEERPMLVVRRDESPLLQTEGSDGSMTFRSLAPTRHQKRIEPFRVEVPPRAAPEALPARGREEFVFVLKGSIEIACGQETCTLQTGDAVYLNAAEKPQISNPGNSAAELICVLSGEEGNYE